MQVIFIGLLLIASSVTVVLSQNIAIKNLPKPIPSEAIGKTIKVDNTENRNLKNVLSNETFVNGLLSNQMDSWTDDDVINHHLAPPMEPNISYIPPKMPAPAVTEKDFNVPEAHISARAASIETAKGVDGVVNKFAGLVKNLGAKYNMLTAKWNASDIKDARAELLRHVKKVAEDEEERRQKAIRLGIPYNNITNTTDGGIMETGTLSENDDKDTKRTPAEENDVDEIAEDKNETAIEKAMKPKISKPLRLRRKISRRRSTYKEDNKEENDDEE